MDAAALHVVVADRDPDPAETGEDPAAVSGERGPFGGIRILFQRRHVDHTAFRLPGMRDGDDLTVEILMFGEDLFVGAGDLAQGISPLIEPEFA